MLTRSAPMKRTPFKAKAPERREAFAAQMRGAISNVEDGA